MSLRSPNNTANNRSCDLDGMGTTFFDTTDGLLYPLPLPPSPISPLRLVPTHIQSSVGDGESETAKNYGTAFIVVNRALQELSRNGNINSSINSNYNSNTGGGSSGSNEGNPRDAFELAMNADLTDMDDDLSAAEFNPATSTVGANKLGIDIDIDIDIDIGIGIDTISIDRDDMDDDLSLAEFHLPIGSLVEPAPLPSMDLFGNQTRNNNNSNMHISPMGNNRWRGITTMI